tara:strand:+ start:18176 stop:18523 length:348 start_codon:yes stop_codon:yes gene_type:complete
MGKEKEMTDNMDKKLDSITLTEEEYKKKKARGDFENKKSPIPTYIRTKKTKPKPEPNPLPPDVRKAMDQVYKKDTEGRQILKELYDETKTNEPKKKEFMTGGMVNPSFGTEFDDR